MIAPDAAANHTAGADGGLEGADVTTCKVYECMCCEYSSGSRNHMQYHVRRHTGEQPFQCSTCGQRFTVKSNLLRHCRTKHKDTDSALNVSV